MLNEQIKDYLDSHDIDYDTIPHSLAYTAAQTAQSAHISGKQLAKTVIIKLDGKLTMICYPANEQIDMEMLRDACEAEKVELAHEYEFADKFPGCDTGAMPPFGELYGDMDVYISKSLCDQRWIAFNAGSHTELLKIRAKDFLNLVHPRMLSEN